MTTRLEKLPLTLSGTSPSDADMVLITAANHLSDRFRAETGAQRIGGLVTSNGRVAADFLRAAQSFLTIDNPRFCEWGSGVGIVTCLAQRAGWRACGIEIEPRLVSAAQGLAAAHGVPVTFHPGSYKPDALFEPDSLPEAFDTGHGFGLFDFDIIYAYPWPAEAQAITQGIARHARDGTVFIRYGGGLQCEAFRVRH